jgi:hypothetical protein
MSSQIPVSFVKQFGQNVWHLAQQKGSKLRNSVRNESVQGDSRFFDRIGSTTAVLKAGRHSDTPQIDSEHSRRMVTLKSYEWADLIDKQDKVRMLIDPTNEYAMAAMWALGRAIDDNIIAAASGSAYGGVDGTTAVVLPTTQKIMGTTGSAASALNVFTLRNAAYYFDANNVDVSEQKFFVFNAYQKNALLGETAISSADYNTVKALVQGQIDTFMGFKFIQTEQLVEQVGTLQFSATTGAYDGSGTNTDGYDKCLAYVKSGICLGIGADMTSKISERADKSYSTQVYASMDIGAARMEEVKVLEVHCKDT